MACSSLFRHCFISRSYSIISRIQKSGKQINAIKDGGIDAFDEPINSNAKHINTNTLSKPLRNNSEVQSFELKEKHRKQTLEKIVPSLPVSLEPVGWDLRMPKVYKNFEQPENPKSLKISFLGPANAGKSTLLNNLVNAQVSTVSPRPQTTRKRTQGIMTIGETQVIFLDSPGVTTSVINDPGTPRHGHHARSGKLKFDRELINAPWRCLEEADHLVILLDALKCLESSTHAENYIFERLSQEKYTLPATLVMNKVDLIHKDSPELTLITEHFQRFYKHFSGPPLYISAFIGSGLLQLQQHLLDLAVSRPWSFPAYIASDISDYDRVVESIRAAYLPKLYSYLPYVFQQVNKGWLENPDGSLHIYQDILVLRPQHQKILVGAQGKVINEVVQEATLDLRRHFARKVKLYLQVQVVDRFPPSK